MIMIEKVSVLTKAHSVPSGIHVLKWPFCPRAKVIASTVGEVQAEIVGYERLGWSGHDTLYDKKVSSHYQLNLCQV